MISSITKKTISLAISLLVVVISLTGVALAATAPTVSTALTPPRYTPGFAGAPGKMARDAAMNFYVTDFWGKGIVKLNRQGSKIGFIPTSGRPSAVAVLPDNRLVVAMAAPQAYVAFYEQSGVAPNVTGEQKGLFTGTPTVPLYRPVAITVDKNKRIYVLDSGDNTGNMDRFNSSIETPASIYGPNVKVYSPAGAWLHEFGERTYPSLVNTGNTNLGRFKLPQGIAYEKTAGQIVVVDTQNGRLQYFTESNGSSCPPVKGVGTTVGPDNGTPSVTAEVKLANPVDVAFEYNDLGVLQRAYVAEKGPNQITVFDPVTPYFFLSAINDTNNSGAAMKLPASLVFERTGTGVSTAGVVYTANAASSNAANIRVLGLDTGVVPVPVAGAMTMDPVAATTTGTSLNVSGTTSPPADVTCFVNGVASGTVVGTASWTTVGGAALALTADSMNYIVCKSTSGGITTYMEASTYSGTDPTVVSVTINPLSTGLYTSSNSVTVSGTTNPVNATVQLVNSLGGTTTIQSDASGIWSTAVTVAEGSNLLTATAWKPGTAVSAPANRTVTADFHDRNSFVCFRNDNQCRTKS
jgi:hypothetical protein